MSQVWQCATHALFLKGQRLALCHNKNLSYAENRSSELTTNAGSYLCDRHSVASALP